MPGLQAINLMTGDRARLEQIRADLAALPSSAWELSAEGAAIFLEGRDASDGSRVRLANFPEARVEEYVLVAGAPAAIGFLLGLVDRAAAELHRARRAGFISRKDFAAEAAMKCGERAFRNFLAQEAGEAILDRDTAAAALRRILAITSRAELSEDDDAAERWRALRSRFIEWQKGGGV